MKDIDKDDFELFPAWMLIIMGVMVAGVIGWVYASFVGIV